MYSRLLSGPSRRKAIPFEQLRCRRRLVGHRPEPVPRGQLADLATGALVTAMTRNGVRRLVCISALGVGDSRGHGGFVFDRLFLPLLLSHTYKDKDGQDTAIRASSLDWVVVRPAMLTNDPARGSVRAVADLPGVKGGKIARADVARFVLEQLTTDTRLR